MLRNLIGSPTWLVVAVLIGAASAYAAPADGDLLRDPRLWLDMASDSAAQVPQASDVFDLYAYVGGAEANAGDKVGANASAQQLMTRSARAASRSDAAVLRVAAASVFIAAGSPQRAKAILDDFEKEVLEKIGKPGSDPTQYRGDLSVPWAISALVVQRARIGDSQHAHALIMKLPQPGDRAQALTNLAEVLLDLKNPAEAKKTLVLAEREVKSHTDSDHERVYRDIYGVLLTAGEFDDAYKLAMADAMSFGPFNSLINSLTDALEWRYERGPQDTALAMAKSTCAALEKLPDREFKSVYDYLKLAKAQAFLAQDPPAALRTLKRAQPLIAAARPEVRRTFLFDTAAIYARAGDDKSSARDLAEVEALYAASKKSQDALQMKFGYQGIAIALAQADRFDDALAMAKKSGRPLALLKIAPALARSGSLARALEMGAASHQASLDDLRTVIAAYVVHGDMATARQTILTMTDPEERGFAELGAAEGLMNKHDSIRYLRRPPVGLEMGAGVGAGAGGGSK